MGSGARGLNHWRQGLHRLRPLGPTMAVCAIGLLPITTCLSKIFFGLPCPACGLTRAGLRLLSGDIAGASRYQPLAVPLVLLFLLMVVSAFIVSEGAWKVMVRWATALAGVGLVGVWALRFVGLFGGPVP